MIVFVSGLETCSGSAVVVAGSCKELFSDSLLASSGLPDKITLELLSIAAGVTPLVMCPTADGFCEVVGLRRLSKGISGGIVSS